MIADRTITRSVFAVTAAAVVFGGAGYAIASSNHGAAHASKPAAKPGAMTVIRHGIPTTTVTKAEGRKPQLAIDLSVSDITREGLVFDATYSGYVPQVYGYGDTDPSLGRISPTDTQYPQNLWTSLEIDGVAQGGSDGGENACFPKAQLVPVHDVFAKQPVEFHDGATGSKTKLAKGRHLATWKVVFCAQGSSATDVNQTFEQSVPFEVS